MAEGWRLPDEQLALGDNALERLRGHLSELEKHVDDAAENARVMFRVRGVALREMVSRLLRSKQGRRLHAPTLDLAVHEVHRAGALPALLTATALVLHDVARDPRFRIGDATVRKFEASVNEVLHDAQCPFMMDRGGWRRRVDAEADSLLGILLKDAGDVAPCRQGDLQVEMVASSRACG